MHEVALYLHWPFCKKKCPYCDFNSHVRNIEIKQEPFCNAIISEIERWKTILPDLSIKSVFFGGGTPSLMTSGSVSRIIDKIYKNFTVANNIEISLEANPTSVESQHFKELHSAGINRLSLGIQSLCDKNLQFLGRNHNSKEAIEALKIVSNLFENYSFDLIYALPQQSINQWHEELLKALEFNPPHISLYQLTIEQNTMFANMMARGELILPEDEHCRELYELTDTVCKQHNLERYEISNYAKIQCQHNLHYWNYGDYLGIGPGAHGRITIDGKKFATMQWKVPETWLQKVQKGNGDQELSELSFSQQQLEALLMGIRLTDGVIVSPDILKQEKIFILAEHGFLDYKDQRLKVLDIFRLNEILSLIV